VNDLDKLLFSEGFKNFLSYIYCKVAPELNSNSVNILLDNGDSGLASVGSVDEQVC
jgi:hypothetical protein